MLLGSPSKIKVFLSEYLSKISVSSVYSVWFRLYSWTAFLWYSKIEVNKNPWGVWTDRKFFLIRWVLIKLFESTSFWVSVGINPGTLALYFIVYSIDDWIILSETNGRAPSWIKT